MPVSAGVVETFALVLAISVVLARIGSRDAMRYRVPMIDVILLVLLGIVWRGIDEWMGILIGAVLGAGAVGLQVPIAKWIRRKRQPVYSGDVYLMGASGALLGPMGLAISWLVNLPLGIVYRVCLARKRGRPGIGGYAPFAPSYCVAAVAVVLWQAAMGRN